MQEPLALKTPGSRKLVKYKSCHLSPVRRRIFGKSGDTETEKILQQSLCEQGKDKEK
ncbi:MAG: hypothetical protein LUE31_08430 [Lachnospiraceae bacterium]|nr:hypothetical protein [Lachnospiraceae bacterium]